MSLFNINNRGSLDTAHYHLICTCTHTGPTGNSGRGYEQDSEHVSVHKHLGSLLWDRGGNDGSKARSEEKISGSLALHRKAISLC